MYFAIFSPPPGLVSVCNGVVSKNIFIPQFDHVYEFMQFTNESYCELIAYLDTLPGDNRYSVRIPIGLFDDIENINDVNYTIIDAVLNFFEKTLQKCQVFYYTHNRGD